MIASSRRDAALEEGARYPASALAQVVDQGARHMDHYSGGRMPFAVVGGKGLHRWLVETEGEEAGALFEALDVAGSYSSTPFGEGNERLERAILEFLRAGGGANDEYLSLERSRLLATLFAEHGPLHEHFSAEGYRVSGRSSGSEGVELALKLVADHSFDFHSLRRRTPAFRVIVFNGAWHGWYSSIVRLMDRRYYKIGLPEAAEGTFLSPLFLEFGDSAALEEAFASHPGEIAAVLLEPVQGDAGILFPPDGYLRRIRELCTEAGALMVADEVMTFAKTGYWLACRDSQGPIRPDIAVVGKYLGMGLVPVSLVVAREDIAPGRYRSVCTNDLRPFVCAVVRAGIEVIMERDLLPTSLAGGERFLAGLRSCAERHPGAFAGVRGRGALFGLELDPALSGKVAAVRALLARAGVLVEVMAGRTRPYIAPTLRMSLPLDMKDEERQAVLDRLEEAMPRLLRLAAPQD